MSSFASAEFRALGTGVTVSVRDAALLDEAVRHVAAELDGFDRACSRFRPDSDLERLNHAGHIVARGVLFDALVAAFDAARISRGVVDPTIGESVRVLGYDADFASIDRQQPPRVRVARVAGWESVIFDRGSGDVHLPRGVRLDLGATAKALAADRCAARAHHATGIGVLVSVGGDLAVAGQSPPDGWPVRVAEHHGASDEEAGETVALWQGGIATSTTTVRRWLRGCEPVHHLVDPRTGSSATSDWRTVTVAASTCTAANTLSTAAVVLGSASRPWLETFGVPCRSVDIDGSIHTVGGWPTPDLATSIPRV